MCDKTNRTNLTQDQAGSRLDGAAGVHVGRPTVASNGGGTLPPNLRAALAVADLSCAEWMRLPPPRSRCRLTGLARTSLIEHGERGAFKMITVRAPGSMRGIRLIHRQSLLDWLARLDAEQNRPTQGTMASDEAGGVQ